MIRQIEIKEGKGFEECKLLELTGNNIFICSKPSVKNRLWKKIKDIWELVITVKQMLFTYMSHMMKILNKI